jgi:hypothetical protein
VHRFEPVTAGPMERSVLVALLLNRKAATSGKFALFWLGFGRGILGDFKAARRLSAQARLPRGHKCRRPLSRRPVGSGG